MCDPTLATAMAISGAQSALQIGAAQQASNRQEAYYRQNRINAIAARDLKVRQENLKIGQEQDNLVDESFTKQLEAMNTRARQIVSAGEAGIAGGVLEALVMETEATSLRNQDAIKKEKSGIIEQSTVNRQGLDAEATNRINSVKRGEPVDALGIIATNALSTYGSYHMAKSYP